MEHHPLCLNGMYAWFPVMSRSFEAWARVVHQRSTVSARNWIRRSCSVLPCLFRSVPITGSATADGGSAGLSPHGDVTYLTVKSLRWRHAVLTSQLGSRSCESRRRGRWRVNQARYGSNRAGDARQAVGQKGRHVGPAATRSGRQPPPDGPTATRHRPGNKLASIPS